MNTPEDRVRWALRETAEDISPTDVPRLRLPDGPGRSRLARGWPSWLTPLAAAAAVGGRLGATHPQAARPGPATGPGRTRCWPVSRATTSC
jgi:hypothetical protein